MKTFVVFFVSYLMLIHSSLVFGFDGWKLGTGKDGSVFAHAIQNKPETLSRVELYIMVNKGFPMLIIYFEPFSPTIERLEKAKGALGSARLIVDDKEIVNYESPTWRKIGHKALAANLILSRQAIQHLRSGKKLKILVLVASVDKEFDPSFEFKLDGLSRLMPEVLN
jgi:hypothetical protein